MSRETRAILFLFEGEQIPRSTISRIGAEIGAACNTENAKAFVFSAQEIAELMLRSNGVMIHANVETSEPQQEKTPEEEAIVYIGEIMETELRAPFNANEFVTALIKKIGEIRASFDPEVNQRFMNAMFILSGENLCISKSLMKKYKFSQEKINAIKQTYNFLAKF